MVHQTAEIEGILNSLFPQRNIKRVMFVNPPDADASLFHYDSARRFRYSTYPPYGLLVLANNLINIGIECHVADLNYEVVRTCFDLEENEFDFNSVWIQKLDRSIQEFSPDIIGVTCMFTMTHDSFAAVCHYLSTHHIPLAVGGVHVTNNVDLVLHDVPAADFVFVHESDTIFKDFVQVVNCKKDISHLSQVIFIYGKSNAGKRISVDKLSRPSVDEISIVPAYHLIDIKNYSKYGVIGQAHFMEKKYPGGTATLLSNRGCRGHCKFCSVRSFNGIGVRQRSILSIIDELELLRNEYGITHIMWLDDDLLYNHERAMRLFNEMIKRNVAITWDATNGVVAASCTDELISAAVESGCIGLTIGVESGNPEILKSVRKPATVEIFLRAAEVLKNYPRVFVRVFLMLGFPEETMRMLRDTIRLSSKMNLDWHSIAPLQVLPNTDIAEEMGSSVQKNAARDIRYFLNNYGNVKECSETILNLGEIFDSDTKLEEYNIADVWFIVNYILNFRRIFNEDRPVKQKYLLDYLRHISNYVVPDHAFALYFSGYLETCLYNRIATETTDRLKRKLDSSVYWRGWFENFGLSHEHLVSGSFPKIQGEFVTD